MWNLWVIDYYKQRNEANQLQQEYDLAKESMFST